MDPDELVEAPYEISRGGTVMPLNAPGLGLEIDEEFIKRYPVIEGPAYV